MPFDPDAYLQAKTKPQAKKQTSFDPDKYLASKQVAPPDTTSPTESAIEGFGKAATLGYLPQLQAGAAKAIEALTPESDVDKRIKEQGFLVKPQQQSYTDLRDEMIGRSKRLQEESPIAYGAGQLGGVLATAPLATQIVPTAAPTLAGRVMQAGKIGALTGLVENPGDVKGEVSPIQAKERALGGAMGAAAGAIGQGVVAEPLSKVGGSLTKFAQEKAVKSSGAMLKDFRRLFGRDRMAEIGDAMFEHGLVKPGYTFSDVAEKSQAIKQRSGAQIGAIYDEITQKIGAKGDAFGLNPKELADRLYGATQKSMPKLDRKAYSDTMSKYIDEITSSGKLSDIRYLNDVIGEISSKVNWAKKTADMAPMEQGFVALRSELRNIVNETADKVSQTAGLDKVSSDVLKRLNKTYGAMAEINAMSSDRVARQAANRFFSPSDYGTAAAGAAIGALTADKPEERIKHAAIGAGLGVANKAARLYALPVIAAGAKKAGGLLEAAKVPPSAAGLISERIRKEKGKK